MPKTLDARMVARLKPRPAAYYVTDAVRRGLQLRIAPDNSRTWSLRYRMGRHQRRLGLGGADVVSLADARAAAKEALKLVARGLDPAQQKREDRDADTIADLATLYIAKRAKPKKRSWQADQRMLDAFILPAWRHRPAKAITRRDVRELVETVPGRVYPNRVRALIHTLFNFAIERDLVEANPAAGTKRPAPERSRDRVLTDDELRQFWQATEAMAPAMRAYWQVRLLTAQRASEIHDMQWRELDLAAGWWTIPAARSKNGLAHRVPLSAPVLALLTERRAAADALIAAREARGDTRARPPVYVFDGARGAHQQRAAAAAFGIPDFRGHDLRRTAASLMTGGGTSRLVVSKILNHAESGITAVYDRHGYDREKEAALTTWARTLLAIVNPQDQGATVLAFPS
jgi:integrase